ncbi:MAG: hypothetical protein J0H74_34920 [Chitinophagaceae bacterium]|nr:hypothetical protein [Chitinophagaceae bacterium]
MKKFKLLTGLSVASILVFVATGCKKDNNNGGGAGISATINGAAWQSQPIWTSANHSGGTTTVAGGYIKSGDSTAITIAIHDSVHVGEPDKFYLSDLLYIRSNGGSEKIYGSGGPGHGTLTLTTRDQNAHRIAGTFSGVFYNGQLDDSVKIDNGQFNLTYKEN